MGFYCPDVTGLVKGQTVELEIDGRGLLPAQICYVSDHPNGANLYFALLDCALCTACTNDCAFEGQGFCI